MQASCSTAVQGCASHPWSTDDAIRVGREVSARGGLWYEEPCRAEDVAGYAAVRRAVDVPVSGVESYGTVAEFERLIEANGVDLVQPDAGMLPAPPLCRRWRRAQPRLVLIAYRTYGEVASL